MTLQQIAQNQDRRNDSMKLRKLANELMVVIGHYHSQKNEIDQYAFGRSLNKLDRCLEFASLGGNIWQYAFGEFTCHAKLQQKVLVVIRAMQS